MLLYIFLRNFGSEKYIYIYFLNCLMKMKRMRAKSIEQHDPVLNGQLIFY